jgi:hypothetical protein
VAINVYGENLPEIRKKAILEQGVEMGLPFPILLDEELKAFPSSGKKSPPITWIGPMSGSCWAA